MDRWTEPHDRYPQVGRGESFETSRVHIRSFRVEVFFHCIRLTLSSLVCDLFLVFRIPQGGVRVLKAARFVGVGYGIAVVGVYYLIGVSE